MRYLSIALVVGSTLAIARTGSAADLPMKAPPAPAITTPIWTGFYVGGHIGDGWGDKSWTQGSEGTISFVLPPLTGGPPDLIGIPGQALGKASMNGLLGGLQAGYNYQAGQWVFGVEATWSRIDMGGSFLLADPRGRSIGGIAQSNIDWIGTAAGRIGFTIDRALLYAGAGAAWTKENDDITGLALGDLPFSIDASNTRFGWTFLTGVEYAFDPHWSARVQYNFYDFGSQNPTLSGMAHFDVGGLIAVEPFLFPVSTELRIQTITAGVNYRF